MTKILKETSIRDLNNAVNEYEEKGYKVVGELLIDIEKGTKPSLMGGRMSYENKYYIMTVRK